MKKVIVVSDSHGLLEPLERIYEQYKGKVDAFLHCGDSEFTTDHPIFEVYQSVKGNCDFEPFPHVHQVVVGQTRIVFTHGHKYHVKFSLNKLYSLGLAHEADIVCFGHTHRPTYEVMEDGMIILNPGSLKNNRGFSRIPECFALITIDQEIKVEFIDQATFRPLEL